MNTRVHSPATITREQHIIVNVPAPKVTVVQEHPPWWIEYGVPSATLILTLLAAVFSGLALRGIREQIRLARRQIDQQDRVIVAALQDLEITSRQARLADADRVRLPKLEVTVLYNRVSANEENQDSFLVYLQVNVRNSGTAPANNIEITLRFPETVVAQAEEELTQSRLQVSADENIQKYLELSQNVDSDGNRWATVFNRHLELLPGQAPWLIGNGWLYVRPGPTALLWSALCRQGAFPVDDGAGAIDVLFS